MRTTPEQRTITASGHWLHVIDAANWIYHFGLVRANADRLDLMAGNLESLVFSRLNRDGWRETVHQSEVWPITSNLYSAMAAADWDVRNMNKASLVYQELTFAYSALLTKGEQERRHERRDYQWFLSEVIKAVRLSGTTGLRGVNRIGDRRIVLRFDSWAVAHGVQQELVARDLPTRKVAKTALDVMDRSER